MIMAGLNQGEVVSIKNFMEQPADKYGNDEGIEIQWAIKAYHHAEIYFNLITTVDPTNLKLSPMDNEIYTDFRERFKTLSVDKIDAGELKSPAGKAKWREFCEAYKGRVEDYNMGSLLRLDANDEATEKNTTLVPRIQFLAIEIARNREGYNSGLRTKFGAAAKAKAIDGQNTIETSSGQTEST